MGRTSRAVGTAAEAGRAAACATTESATQTPAHAAKTLGLRHRATDQSRDDGRAHNQLIRFHVRISR